MDFPDQDALIKTISEEADRLARSINVNSSEWQAIARYMKAKRWLLAHRALTASSPEALENTRGRAAMLWELLTIHGQSDDKG